MKAYVINLTSRTDRWDSVEKQGEALGMSLIRVDAVSKDETLSEPFVTSAVAAAWYSHRKAMNMFLASGDEYALILEDDFLLRTRWKNFDFSKYESLNIDFFQIGYLITTPVDRLEMKIKASIPTQNCRSACWGRGFVFFWRINLLYAYLVVPESPNSYIYTIPRCYKLLRIVISF